MDGHSFSRPDEVRTRHLDLALELDFDQRTVRGRVRLEIERRQPDADLWLDSHGLVIEAVQGADGQPRAYELTPEVEHLGSALRIELAAEDQAIEIRYRTTEASAALQWLEPEQTDSGRPFVFTQGQAILTRSWIPCQDSPAVRASYSAEVRCPSSLVPVMSAQARSEQDGVVRFEMPLPIPAYLIALACGEIEFRAISARCGVWAEPGLVDSARAELEDLEAMIVAAEKLFGPYRWGRYDLIILPPSFPLGGMENPCLTFATPTILAGDKSLVSLVAHELAHSWSGNLVTNASWNDFWLNEGFTVYIEKRIMEVVYGREQADMETELDMASLREEMASMPVADQVLRIDLSGRNPDDAFSPIPYDKGACFLRWIEQQVGRESFDAFLQLYFETHAFQSLDTEGFEEFLRKELLYKEPGLIIEGDVAEWIHGPGLPEHAPTPVSQRLIRVRQQAEAWREGRAADRLETTDWSTHEWLQFLESLPQEIQRERMEDLDEAFRFTDSGNSEILSAWLCRCIRQEHTAAFEALERFLLRVGRRKFLKPLYTELAKTPAGLERARAIYARARSRYHAMSRRTIDEILSTS